MTRVFDARQVPAAVISTSNKDTINLSAVSARDVLPSSRVTVCGFP